MELERGPNSSMGRGLQVGTQLQRLGVGAVEDVVFSREGDGDLQNELPGYVVEIEVMSGSLGGVGMGLG